MILASLSASVSVVIPVYNEAANLPELARRLRRVVGSAAELIVVDDGSTDGSLELARHLPEKLKVVPLPHHLGKSRALETGFRCAKGQYVVTMDGDLQDQPEEIPHLLEQLAQGWDLVSGWKKVRQDPITKTFPSWVFNSVIRRATGLPLHDINCGLKAYRQELAASLRLPEGYHRLIPLLAHVQGWRVTEVAVKHAPRRHGHSKYGFLRYFPGLVRALQVILASWQARHGLPAAGRLRAQRWLDSLCPRKSLLPGPVGVDTTVVAAAGKSENW